MEPAPPLERAFVRAADDRVVAGVAAGLAGPLGVDPAVVRLGLLLLVPVGGAGLFVYAAGWALLPPAAPDPATPDRTGADPGAGAVAAPSPVSGPTGPGAAAAALLLGAALLVLRAAGLGTSSLVLPLLLVVAAAFLLWWRAATTAGDPPDAAAPDGPAGASPRVRWSTRRWIAFSVGAAALVFGLVAVAGVVVAGRVADAAGPSSLAAAGTGVLLTRPGSRTRRVALLALLLAGAGTARAVWAVPFEGGSGPRTVRPATLEELAPEYRHRMGTMELDLSALPAGDGREVVASVAVGELVVILPELPVELHTRVGLGWSDVLGDARRGYVVTTDVESPGGVLVLDLDVGSGSLRVVGPAYRSAP